MTSHTLLDKWKWLGAVMADKSLAAAALRAAYFMAEHICDEREIAYPSCERLAGLTGMCVRTMEEALGRVRADLGPDALILSTRR